MAEAAGIVTRLNQKNVLNLVLFVSNAVLTYGIGNGKWLGNGSNAELSAKYQTLITPDGKAFSIWGVIFLSQAIFSVIQLLPRFRGTSLIQDGVRYYYALACGLQIAWTFAFAFELIPLSLVTMALLWAALIRLLWSQNQVNERGGRLEFWLIRFPFAIHGGWLTAALALNTNVFAVWAEAPADVQLATGIICLAVLHAAAVWALFGSRRPEYTTALVLSWATLWIAAELTDPKESILATFDAITLSGVSRASLCVSVILVGMTVVRVGVTFVRGHAALAVR